MNLEKLLSNQPKKRKEQIELLKWYLLNPGGFCLLVLGDRGTGKKFWINQLKDDDKVLTIVNAKISESSYDYWETQFKKAHQGYLLLEDIELLDKQSQAILFDGLGTEDGTFGFSEKKYEFQLISTSTKSIKSLRDTEKYLTHRFFDRIGQLIVSFPNFSESSNRILNDFKSTWKKFKFETEYPKLIEPWLGETAHKLYGNFRDLDKLCIIWNNYQLMGKSEEEIFKLVKEDFNKFYRFPETATEHIYKSPFSRDKTYQDMLDHFKLKLKDWAKSEFGSLRKASESLGISHRTMERW